MADIIKDMRRETATVTGASNPYSLSGAVMGYGDFDGVMADNDRAWFRATDGDDYETFLGTFTSGSPDTIARTFILESSNSNNAVVWGTDTVVDIIMGAPAAWFAHSGDNKFINSAMEIDQLNEGVAVTVNGTGTFRSVDMWEGTGESADGVFTMQRQSGGPSGFKNFLRAAVTTADASVGASQRYLIGTRVEGNNIVDLAWGTADAQYLTVSFWARCSIGSGTYGGALANSDFSRVYPFTFTLTGTGWQRVVVVVPPTTSGTWETGVLTGFKIYFQLGAGSSVVGTPGAWTNLSFVAASGATSIIGTLNATFDITGAKAEAGPLATPYAREDYITAFDRCRRYVEKSYNDATAVGASSVIVGAAIGVAVSTIIIAVNVFFKTKKRASPTVTLYSYAGTTGDWSVTADNSDTNAVSLTWGSSQFGFARVDTTGLTAGAGYMGHWLATSHLP